MSARSNAIRTIFPCQRGCRTTCGAAARSCVGRGWRPRILCLRPFTDCENGGKADSKRFTPAVGFSGATKKRENCSREEEFHAGGNPDFRGDDAARAGRAVWRGGRAEGKNRRSRLEPRDLRE